MTKPTLLPKNRNIFKEIAEQRKSGSGKNNEDWLDDQESLDAVTANIAKNSPDTPQNIKVIESLNRPMNCSELFQALCARDCVRSLSLVGVHLDENAARRLSETLRHPQTKIRVLQVWRHLPSCLGSLCEAIKENKELREIRLTFHGDLNDEQTSMLLDALETNQGLEAIKLFGVDLSRHSAELESLVRNRQITKELRLTRCQLSTISGLAKAISESNTLQTVDMSMNELSNDADIATMLQSKNLRSVILSKNQLGKEENGSTFGQVLAANEMLEELFLEGNPLSTDFAASIREALQVNTTLRRFGFMKSYMGKSITASVDTEIRNLVALNQAGRRWLRAASQSSTPASELAVLPHLLQRSNDEHSVSFGVLREYTNLWVQP